MRFPHLITGFLTACTLLYPSPARPQTPATTVGGYGELHYNEPDGPQKGKLDFHRFVIELEHEFNDNISFEAEVELEHTRIEAGDPEGGELSLEEAYVRYRLSPALGIKGGILLVPVGFINLHTEPTEFHGVERPNVERVIIPTTWRESGIGVFGAITTDVRYQAYVVAGLKAEGFSAERGLRDGRQSGFESDVSDPSITGRIDFTPSPGVSIGVSGFYGNSTGGVDSLGSGTVALWSADARYADGPLELRALGALGTIADASKINARFGNSVADRIYGFYVEAAYDMLPHLAGGSDQQLSVFARYERYNTQAAVTGFVPMSQYDRTDIVTGITYRPVPNVAVKTDYTWFRNAQNAPTTPNTSQFNLGIAYSFE